MLLFVLNKKKINELILLFKFNFEGFFIGSQVNAYFGYFNSAVTSCYYGNVTLTSSNINNVNSTAAGSCLALGLTKISCPSTYGCAVSFSSFSLIIT